MGGGPLLTLRPHQSRALDALREKLRAGSRAPLLVSPTGSGKSVIAAAIASLHLSKPSRSVVAIVPRLQLVEQLSADLARECPEGGWSVRTIQALQQSGERPPATLLIADEAHHYVSAEWLPVVQHYRADPACTVLGLTATPCRGDGTALGHAYDSLTVAATVRELTGAGYLVPCDVIGPGARSGAMAEDPVAAYVTHGGGRRCIVFARDMAHSRLLASRFVAKGIACASVESDLSDDARAEALDRFRRGVVRVLVNCQILTEGFDDPSVEVVVLARGCAHAGTFLQIVGRGLRISPATGKARCTVLDLHGVVHDHGLPDDDRAYSLTGEAIAVADTGLAIRQCPQCGQVFRAEEFAAVGCPGCGYKIRARKDPAVRRQEMKLVRAAHTPEKRAAEWASLQKAERARGYKRGWAANVYRSRYGGSPPR